MILDTLDQADRYTAISPRFAKAFAFLRIMTDDVPVGRHEIDGDDVFALVQAYDTMPTDKRFYEVHRKYIDVQFIHRGREIIYWVPLPMLTNETMAFDADKDAALYGLTPEGRPIQMSPGQFAILFPADGHIPCCQWGEPTAVRKVVVKVRVD